MSRIPDLKRITVEDFKAEDRPLVQKLAFVINSFHEQVRNILNANVDFDNLNQEIKNLRFTTGENGQPLNRLSFRTNLNGRVNGVLIIRTNITSNNTLQQQVMPIINFSQDGESVNVTSIGGLIPNTGYELTLLIL
jgi:hypothetical protein